MAAKQVYFFGGGKADGNAKMKELLGGKGANLAEMAKLDVPVPPGFTITTEV
jgi:pyruvate,orthophosphate dikinase